MLRVPGPALAPRLKLRITTRPVDNRDRTPGIGALDQIRADVQRLSRLGATQILLDTTIPGEPRPPGTMERDWRWIQRFRAVPRCPDSDRHCLIAAIESVGS
jgi:hypothetical protein